MSGIHYKIIVLTLFFLSANHSTINRKTYTLLEATTLLEKCVYFDNAKMYYSLSIHTVTQYRLNPY